MTRLGGSTREASLANDRYRLGDRVRLGRRSGRVVGVIERQEYADEVRSGRWAGLGRGVLVLTDDGEVVHVRDGATVLVLLETP